jgi:hypothetical protein
MSEITLNETEIEATSMADDASEKLSASQRQVGGTHYQFFEIQPFRYIQLNQLGFLEGCVIKRMSRWDKPTGKGLEDLEKAKHEIELLIEILNNNND